MDARAAGAGAGPAFSGIRLNLDPAVSRIARALADLRVVAAAQETAMARFAEQARGLLPQLRIMDETHVFARDDERVSRVIEMQRNRDTGPALPPLGRRVR